MQCAATVQHVPAGKEADADFSTCDKALELDPNNVLAMGLVAFKLWARANYGQSKDRSVDIRDAERLIERGLALDPTNARLYWIKASVLGLEFRFDEAAVAAERSIALDPSDINAYWNLCLLQYLLGRPEQVLTCIDKAIRLSPRDVRLSVLMSFKGNANFMMQRYERALEWYRQSYALNPNDPLNNIYFIATLSLAGHEQDAHLVLERYLASANPRSPRTIARVMARRISQNPLYLAAYEHIEDGLRKAGMPEK
jgi:tetratricopeptide (TPR) repeat protein